MTDAIDITLPEEARANLASLHAARRDAETVFQIAHQQTCLTLGIDPMDPTVTYDFKTGRFTRPADPLEG